MQNTSHPSFQEYFLKPGYIYISRIPALISTVLGSCVAVSIWDRKREYGGMSHFLYPLVQNPAQATAQYGNVAVKALLRLLLEEGSQKGDLEAQIFGGAHLPEGLKEAVEVSRLNISIGREVLTRNEVAIVSEDVGGTKGRKLIYNTLNNEVVIFRVDKLRKSDWYPYADPR